MVANLVGGLLQIAGLVMVVAGCFAIASWLGWIVAGLATVFVGIRVEIAR